MSLNDIKHRVGTTIGITANSFEIEIYDKRFKSSFLLDDEHVEELNERLPRVYPTTLSGDILLNSFRLGELYFLSNTISSLKYRK